MRSKDRGVSVDMKELAAADTGEINHVHSCLLNLSSFALCKIKFLVSPAYFLTLNLPVEAFPVETHAYKSRIGVGHCHMKTCDTRLSHNATSEGKRTVSVSKINANVTTYHLQT